MKQNLKKIGLLLIALLIFSVTISCADAPSLQTINVEIEKKYGYPDYFKPSMTGVGDFNDTILEKYRVPVYGEPHGGEKEVDSKTGRTEPRFLGYNRKGESVPNPKFPHDSITSKPFSKMDWFYAMQPGTQKNKNLIQSFSLYPLIYFLIMSNLFIRTSYPCHKTYFYAKNRNNCCYS